MENTDGYIRTSRKRIEGTAGSDPEAQAHQLRHDGEQRANLHNTFTFTQGQADQLLRGEPQERQLRRHGICRQGPR